MYHNQKSTLKERFGEIPTEFGLKKEMRLHQGWWRANVLSQEAGFHPHNENKRICNTILNGDKSKSNFLTENTHLIVKNTLEERGKHTKGIIEQDRLFNNLLSSQPLCFNFFAELSIDTDFGLSVLKTFYPSLTKLRKVFFEFAPEEKYTGDNSAFDVAFEVEEDGKVGLVGLECKYTDSFSPKVYDNDFYKNIYAISKSFSATYDELIHSRINQLFRNQLLAEGLLQNNKYSFIYTGLFCMQEDKDAIATAKHFESLLNPLNTNFKIITYKDFIINIQRLNIDWDKREWTMLLWARYCATKLSFSTIEQLKTE